MPKNLGVDTFPDPLSHFGAHWHAVLRCGRCGVAGDERVPPAPLGWYCMLNIIGLIICSLIGNSLVLYNLILGKDSLGKKRIKTLFLHLALADVLVTMFPMAGKESSLCIIMT